MLAGGMRRMLKAAALILFYWARGGGLQEDSFQFLPLLYFRWIVPSPLILFEMTTGYQLAFSAHPSVTAMGFILSGMEGQSSRIYSREILALIVKNIHWILWKAKITGCFKRNVALILLHIAF